MSGSLRYCAKCRKLFVPTIHASLCGTCLDNVRAQPDPGDQLRAGGPDRPCERCGKNERVAKQRFCLNCKLDMHRGLGVHAKQMSGETVVKQRLEGTVREALNAKRKRTPMNRFNPAIRGVKGR